MGVLENKEELYHEKYTQKWCIKKKRMISKGDKTLKNMSKLNSIVPNSYKYSLVPIQELLFQGWMRDWIYALMSLGVPNSNFVYPTYPKIRKRILG